MIYIFVQGEASRVFRAQDLSHKSVRWTRVRGVGI